MKRTTLQELLDLEMLYEYIFGNESLTFLSLKYNTQYPFNYIKRIAQRIGIVEDTFDKHQLQASSQVKQLLEKTLQEKRNFDTTIDDIFLL